jgi:hypothetical protein
MQVKSKYKESLKTLYVALENSVRKVGKDVQESMNPSKKQTQKA